MSFRLTGQQLLESVHRIEENIREADCHVCICGDAKMGDDVLETFVSIAMGVGGLSRELATDFFASMKRQRRYQADGPGA